MKRAAPPSAPRLVPAVAATLVALGTFVPGAAVAQEDPDFLFGQPRITFGLKGGYAQPMAGSEVFDLARDTLTATTSDFASPALGLEIGVRLHDRVDLGIDFLVMSSRTDTEFRNWVDLDERPIEQTTTFKRIPVTVSLKGYLWERGRSVGRFAWIPRDWTPYAGVGGGVVWWDFRQEGEFVDFETLEIFNDRFTSDGTAATVHALAGVEVSLGHRWILSGEARYSWAEGEMNDDFGATRDPRTGELTPGFEPIDLSGIQLTIGISGRLARPGG